MILSGPKRTTSNMPKPRQTCTNCTVHHAKCDRKQPCTRCVRKNEANSCSREWQDGRYDPQMYRIYPKSKGNDVRQAARNSHQPSQAADEPESPIWGSSDLSSDSLSSYTPSSIIENTSAESFANAIHHSPANSGPRDTKETKNQHLQTLVPTNSQISRLVEYHEQFLLWYHGCVHGPTFRMDLNKALQGSHGLQLKSLDFRWSALLFSIMTASLTCSSDSVAHSWGFTKAQKHGLSKQWYEASVACLHLGDYTSKFSLYSVQAIQILTLSAHVIGFSDEQFVFCRAAFRIAQNLGLQRLAQEPELDNIPTISARTSLSREHLPIRREVGRRI